jgi:hypothetical protein
MTSLHTAISAVIVKNEGQVWVGEVSQSHWVWSLSQSVHWVWSVSQSVHWVWTERTKKRSFFSNCETSEDHQWRAAHDGAKKEFANARVKEPDLLKPKLHPNPCAREGNGEQQDER